MARNEHKKVLQQLSEAYQKVIKEYSLNEPQGHTGGPHYDSIEDLFAQRVERISDHGDAFDVSHFEDLKPYIANWDTLLEIIDEENTEGFSERWEEVRFKYGPKGMRSEDAEGAITAEDGLAAMELFYKVLKGQSDAFVEMTDEQEAKYENLEALIRDELMYPL